MYYSILKRVEEVIKCEAFGAFYHFSNEFNKFNTTGHDC